MAEKTRSITVRHYSHRGAKIYADVFVFDPDYKIVRHSEYYPITKTSKNRLVKLINRNRDKILFIYFGDHSSAVEMTWEK